MHILPLTIFTYILVEFNILTHSAWQKVGLIFLRLLFLFFDKCDILFQHVGWWSPTIIRGDDREAVHIPNHKFTVNVVRNLSQKTHWRIKTHLAISHLDVNKINVRSQFTSPVCQSFAPRISLLSNNLMWKLRWLLFYLQNIVADMRKVLAKNPQVEQQRLHRRVFLENINPENQALMVRLFLSIYFSVTENVQIKYEPSEQQIWI